MKNILVTIDFDKEATLLIAKAQELAKALDSKIWLLHIAAPDPDFVGYSVGPQYVRDNRAHELRAEHQKLQNYAADLNKEGIAAEGLLIEGATIEMILFESQKLNIDLIIAGHHNHGFMYKAFVENVSAGILKKSKIPVMIIPLE